MIDLLAIYFGLAIGIWLRAVTSTADGTTSVLQDIWGQLKKESFSPIWVLVAVLFCALTLAISPIMLVLFCRRK